MNERATVKYILAGILGLILGLIIGGVMGMPWWYVFPISVVGGIAIGMA